MIWLYLAFALLCKATSEGSLIRQDLGGTTWTAVGTEPSSNVVIQLQNTNVPGCVHTDWMQGKSPTQDPYYGFNDINLRWIAQSSWKYSRTFSVSGEFLSAHEHWLVFDGVDTFTNVSLNGKLIGRTHDMFVTYRFNVTGILQPNYNMLEVAFESAITVASNQVVKQPYTIPPNCPPDVQQGICHVNLIRKEQCSFSWDWGPAFATQGIWMPVYLEAYSSSFLSHASAAFDWDKKQLVFDLKFRVPNHSKTPSNSGNVTVTIEELGVSTHFSNVTMTNTSHGNGYLHLVIDMAKVPFKPWWPNGYGSPVLYNISVEFISATSLTKSIKHFRFGFRKVELIQEKIEGSPGLSFYFKINGATVWAKGANWIPADAFKNRITYERYENLLTSAHVANMNMLRVWGGGIYEDNRFYQLADELGIMIWQDFMFACALYPTSQEFLDNVTQELTDQIWRLKHHASIVAWAGNNENEAALATNWYNTTDHFDRYKKDYVKLYIDTIRTLVLSLDDSRPFLSSSPTNAAESADEGWVATNPYSVQYGDVHYYNYKDDCLDWTKFPKTRFASEYGFQSWPSFEAIEHVSEARDWTLDSDWSSHRQHHGDGNRQMVDQIEMHFAMPDVGNSTQVFRDTLYLTQVMQSLCYKAQTEFYRRSRNEIVDGAGHTMGALYWQLNDIWQAPTWSSTEYGGKWKMLHYFALDFFAPLSLIAYDDDTQLTVYAASDLDRDADDSLVVSVRSWEQFGVLGSFSSNASIPAHRSSKLLVESVGSILHYGNCPYQNLCYITVSLQNNHDVAPAFLFPLNFKEIQGLKKPNIQVSSVVPAGANTFKINLVSTAPALFVWIEAIGVKGRFSSNGFVMYDPTVQLVFHSWENTPVDAGKLKDSLQIKSLADIYKNLNATADALQVTSPADKVSTGTWLDDVTAKLTFAVVGLLFIILAAVQITCLVLRLNTPNKHHGLVKSRSGKFTNNNNNNNNYDVADNHHGGALSKLQSSSSMGSSRNDSVQDDGELDEPAAFLIQSKRGYGHNAKKTEIRFYVI